MCDGHLHVSLNVILQAVIWVTVHVICIQSSILLISSDVASDCYCSLVIAIACYHLPVLASNMGSALYCSILLLCASASSDPLYIHQLLRTQWSSVALAALNIVLHLKGYCCIGNVVSDTLNIPNWACLSTRGLPMQKK